MRLELVNIVIPEALYNDFNSIKVRLELIGNCDTYSRELVFQFHKGAIRTTGAAAASAAARDFNSIKVRLEPEMVAKGEKVYLFQFHKGAIRTKCLFTM